MHYRTRFFALFAVLLMNLYLMPHDDAFARAGGGRSYGSRGSRSYSVPRSPSPMSPSRQYQPAAPYQPAPSPYQQPRRGFGAFGTGLLGGLAGGLLGGMLGRSLGFGGGGGGGGIGLLEILIFAGIGYMIYKFMTRSKKEERGDVYQMTDYQRQEYQPTGYQPPPAQETGPSDVESGVSYIRQMDPSFDETRFKDQVMDIFFRIQGAWMNRDLSGVATLLTDEMRGLMQQDIDTLRREHRVNRLENIAVRTVEIAEAWQETGQDYLTALIYANLLDYTTDDTTGAVVSGSKTEPVKFEEYWTFVRPVGNNPWKLSAINQK